MSKVKKYAVLISTMDGGCKRSLTMTQIETLWICAGTSSMEMKKKYFTLRLTFWSGEFNKAVVIKKLPLGYTNKFKLTI